ncbi:unnamed protein product [Blepharisma stoltei]|uniref:Dickkopf N-terminal cysteine-rich domain-containing protein n=1 Tax=Blepharisma stoltei TaxID=1481888 RepID=A0AAU9J629_9CILI|nr:unnamed protein product [Blepharisma stoltei]
MDIWRFCLVSFSISMISAAEFFPEFLGNPNCPAYTCKTSSQQFLNTTCIFFTPTASTPTYFVNPCTSLKLPYCQPSTESNSTCGAANPTPPVNAWPGEKCSTSADCSSYANQGCVKNVCMGASQGDECKVNDDCNPGYRCLGGICQIQIPVGGTGCTNDYDCVNGAGCNIAKTSSESICYPYYSIAQHLPVNSCSSSNQSMLCNSGLCMANNEGFECMAPVQSSKLPAACQLDSDCQSTRDDYFPNGYLTGTCYCGYNPNSASYCSLFAGDKPMLQMMSYLKSWVQSKFILKCNTMRRFTPACISNWWNTKDYNYYMYYYLSAYYYPLITNGESCVQQVYLPQWWAAKNAI